ncbi:MAG: HlyC/CorC family transporter [Alphaproteobacteria bacterium]|nr:MAG: HlyC/CorC family transporter [Alphaproteobacteria bacterium]
MSEASRFARPAARNGNNNTLGNGTAAHSWEAVWRRLRGLFRSKNDESPLRDTIEEIIGEIEEAAPDEEAPAIGSHEKLLLTNILKLRHLTAYDLMVPRADIVSVEIGAGLDEVIETMSRAGHSRLPVYRDNLDDVIGLVHIKDILPYTRTRAPFELTRILRDVSIVAPSMRALDLLLEMRLSRVHMALVVDEFGGIDGLITIEDLVEQIVGEIEDEHDVDTGPKLIERPDGSLIADARATIEEFEARVGPVLSAEEREEDIDTLGGLVSYLAERVPTRGELIVHPATGISFEVLEADPRRVKRLRVRNLPPRTPTGTTDGHGG